MSGPAACPALRDWQQAWRAPSVDSAASFPTHLRLRGVATMNSLWRVAMQQIAAGSKSSLERESDRCQKTKVRA
jgi:hypothetical protein